MDHLILPRDPIQVTIEAPLLSLDCYDGGDLAGYPGRANWPARSVAEWQAIFRRPPEAFTAFLQRWLYFGFLDRVLGQRIPIQDFVRYGGDSDLLLSTKKLSEYISRWKLRGMKKTSNDMEFAYIMHHGLLKPTYEDECAPVQGGDKICSLSTFIMTGSRGDPRGPEIATTTTCMMDYIYSSIMHQGIRPSSDDPNREFANLARTWFSPEWEKLRGMGWCPSQLIPMFDQLNVSGLLFMSSLRRPKPEESHDVIRIRRPFEVTTEQHSSPVKVCTPLECSFRKISPDSYKTAHVVDCPGCSDVGVVRDDLFKILKNGHIPLVSSTDAESTGSNHIRLVERNDPDMAFVAISHVWSDGLGNLQENALPRCQLHRIDRLIRNLPGKASNIVYFWIDTICVPPDNDDAEQQNAQALAIEMMRYTYADATAVLVLDSWLFSTSSKNKDDVEILMRIFGSAWNSRLWTYQEGALAKLLYFQFQDSAYELDEGQKRLNNTNDWDLALTLIPPLNSRYHSLRQFRMPGLRMNEKLLAVCKGLKFRSTSVSTDEALCLAALLDLDMGNIVRTAPSSRMEVFWKSLRKIPLEMLEFLGEPMDKPGLRWAPRSFLYSESNIIKSSGAYGGASSTQPSASKDHRQEYGRLTERGPSASQFQEKSSRGTEKGNGSDWFRAIPGVGTVLILMTTTTSKSLPF